MRGAAGSKQPSMSEIDKADALNVIQVNTASSETSNEARAEKADADLPGKIGPDGKREYGGPKGPEPTRFGDWERKGRCVDF